MAHPGATPKAGGSCQYCGNGIRWLYHVRSADGRRFHVGCDCIAKVFAASEPVRKAVEAAHRKAVKKAKDDAAHARFVAAQQRLTDDPTLLTDKPHPQAWASAKGMTLRDSVEWFLKNAGQRGKIEACKLIEAA